jgi:hypothetical protein
VFIDFSRLAFKYGQDEFFALKRRPIRFNRKEKKIYAIRHRRFGAKPGEGDITWEVPWNDKPSFASTGEGPVTATFSISDITRLIRMATSYVHSRLGGHGKQAHA